MTRNGRLVATFQKFGTPNSSRVSANAWYTALWGIGSSWTTPAMAAAATRTRSPILYDGFMRKILAFACLLPSLAAAQPSFEQASLRFFEQADGPILPVERRVYTTRFDAVRTRRLGVEVAGTYAAPDADATLSLACILKKPDGTTSPAERPMDFRFYGGESGSAAANLLWGRPTTGIGRRADTKSSASRRQARSRSRLRDEPQPAEVADGEIRVKALRIFPVEGNLPPIDARQYSSGWPPSTRRRSASSSSSLTRRSGARPRCRSTAGSSGPTDRRPPGRAQLRAAADLGRRLLRGRDGIGRRRQLEQGIVHGELRESTDSRRRRAVRGAIGPQDLPTTS
jgi:hypothetical protein